MNAFLDSVGYDGWILPALLLIPLAGTVLIWLQSLIAGRDERPARVVAATDTVDTAVVVIEENDAGKGGARQIAFWTLLIEFIVSAGLWWSFDPSVAGWQAVVDQPWIATWNAKFTLGIDGISLMMILLTTFLMPLAVLGSWTSIRRKPHAYYALLLILTTGM